MARIGVCGVADMPASRSTATALVATLRSIGDPSNIDFEPFYLPRLLPVVSSRAR